MDDSSETRDMGSGGAGSSGVAYDSERLGEPGQPGVPTGDQRPTNEGDEKKEIVADVHIAGARPVDGGDSASDVLSSDTESLKAARDAGSLGDLVEAGSPPVLGGQSAGAGHPTPEHDPDTPEGKIERARAESFPGGVPEDADVGTGRKKGQALPPGSVDKGRDTPQTPVT